MTLGTILGIANAGLAIGSTIKNAIEQRRKERIAKDEATALKSQYEAEANQDPMTRSENQKLLNDYDRQAQKQQETARNMSVITGATPEASASVQKAVAEGRSDLMSNMAADASARADVNKEKARQVEKDYAIFQKEQAQAAQESAINGLLNAGNALGTVVDSIEVKPKTAAAPVAKTETAPTNLTMPHQNAAKLRTASPVVSKSDTSNALDQTSKGIMERINRMNKLAIVPKPTSNGGIKNQGITNSTNTRSVVGGPQGVDKHAGYLDFATDPSMDKKVRYGSAGLLYKQGSPEYSYLRNLYENRK